MKMAATSCRIQVYLNTNTETTILLYMLKGECGEGGMGGRQALMAGGAGPSSPFMHGGVGPHLPFISGGVGPRSPFVHGGVGPLLPFVHGGVAFVAVCAW